MRLHELKPHIAKSSKKRVGRGGKRGTYSGKGQKGQKSRAGAKMRPGMREELIRTPKLRGYKNKPKSDSFVAINLDVVAKMPETDITKSLLLSKKLIKPKQNAKILGSGSIHIAKNVVGMKVSKLAKEKIEKAGGKILIEK